MLKLSFSRGGRAQSGFADLQGGIDATGRARRVPT
jgi:hypothetical protein